MVTTVLSSDTAVVAACRVSVAVDGWLICRFVASDAREMVDLFIVSGWKEVRAIVVLRMLSNVVHILSRKPFFVPKLCPFECPKSASQ